MRILWVKVGGLWPLTAGGRLRSFHTIAGLSRRHRVTVLTTHGPGDDHDALVKHLPECERVLSFPHAVPKRSSIGFGLALARSWLSRYPVDLRKWQVPALRAEVDRLVAARDIDVCIADFLFAVANVPLTGRLPVIFFAHNVEHMIWKRLSRIEPRLWRRALLELEWRKVRHIEADACLRASLTLAVSEEDRRLLLTIAPGARATAIPTGVDTSYFAPNGSHEDPARLAFTGSMDWFPNEDAILHAIETILPLIRSEMPEVSLTVAGRNPTSRLLSAAAQASVRVTGTVEDVRPYIAEAALYVVPLRVGGGTRLKILEALAMGKAVVSTTIGAEGLPLTPGTHFVRADDPRDFARAVVSLLRDPGRRKMLGSAGRQLAEQRHSWPQVVREFEMRCEEVVARPGQNRPAPTSPRVVLICHDAERMDAEGLASWLANSFDLVGMVVLRETSGRFFRKAKREIARAGLLGFLDVLAFRAAYRLSRARADEAWITEELGRLRTRYPASLEAVPRLHAADPNTEEVRDFLQRLRPDLVIARCKFILKPEIFEIPTSGTFVLHPGICPEYRNAHGCFWALVNRDLERVGMTLLRADKGVDTGPMFLQAGYKFDEVEESHVVIQHRVVFENLEAIRRALMSAWRGEAEPLSVDGRRSATWGQPRLLAYLQWKRAARRQAQGGRR